MSSPSPQAKPASPSKTPSAEEDDKSESSTSSASSASEASTNTNKSQGKSQASTKPQADVKAKPGFGQEKDEFQPPRSMRDAMDVTQRIEKLAGGTTSEARATASAAKAKADNMQRNFRKIMVMRCAERLDVTVSSFVQVGFSEMGKYKMFDLNMPATMVNRGGNNSEFVSDPPISEIGNSVCQLTGRGLALNKVEIGHLFVSPALRCVQTAQRILKGMITSNVDKSTIPKLKLEPGLFEYMKWYTEGCPNFMSEDDLGVTLSTEFDKSYKPYWSVEEMKAKSMDEEMTDYYERMAAVMDHILQTCKDNKNILIIGHATTVDGITRKLRGVRVTPPGDEQLPELGKDYPHGSMITVQYNPTANCWRHCNNPVPPLTCCDFSNKVQLETFCRDPN